MNALSKFDLVFWDFDGVIKDSVEIKGEIFRELFSQFGPKIAERVYSHHLKNGGVSRQHKIPLYLSWAHVPVTEDLIQYFCNEFSKKTIRGVVDSPSNVEVVNYLEDNYKKQEFILVTATPDEEIHEILKLLKFTSFFSEVYGSSMTKSSVIRSVLDRRNFDSTQVIFVGDSESDYFAAQENSINFFLIPGEHNKKLQEMIGMGKNCYE